MNDKILLYIEKAVSVFCSEENTSAHADFVDIKVYCEVRAAAKPVKLFCIVPEGVSCRSCLYINVLFRL